MPENNRGVSYEIYKRLGRIEGKLDSVKDINDKTNKAYDVAHEAKSMAENNKDDLRDYKTNMKWVIGLLTSVVVPLVIFVLNQFF
ncbi:DUF2951 family protein [Mammaliicoccus sciuri]|uniref:DUF2951 family protein n=1 Tax=Mammaliicoccus sciuri TaxID=1296 RepID=UPI00065BA76B|nr:DUF2951 family protein [Mammaliicoccus sciuri]MBV5103767.1 hemolysin XhlA family protein [Mammaliicoccus sciuri]PNY95986.1 hypothetical protein CD035_03195 [Mammaliicoccus sciuri]WRY62516.1 DUF2951 family protein [Mammaliicoccus sciuri]CAG7914234.1 hypothetical protein SSCS72_02031 [Mammaliicoccus sciuri]SFV43875.1 Hypothetical protein SSCIU_00666 [Mammaliicoccus sciuri]